MRFLVFLCFLIPFNLLSSQQEQPPMDAKARMEQRERINREIERERQMWRMELVRHEQDCRRERDRINREHQNRIENINRRERDRRP